MPLRHFIGTNDRSRHLALRMTAPTLHREELEEVDATVADIDEVIDISNVINARHNSLQVIANPLLVNHEVILQLWYNPEHNGSADLETLWIKKGSAVTLNINVQEKIWDDLMAGQYKIQVVSLVESPTVSLYESHSDDNTSQNI